VSYNNSFRIFESEVGRNVVFKQLIWNDSIYKIVLPQLKACYVHIWIVIYRSAVIAYIARLVNFTW
jgi:hypothetical protein